MTIILFLFLLYICITKNMISVLKMWKNKVVSVLLYIAFRLLPSFTYTHVGLLSIALK